MILNLTGIRGVAALWVVAFHFKKDLLDGIPHLHFLDPLFSRGHFGVDLFFFLSGFILGHVYLKEFEKGSSRFRTVKSFFIKRLARLYPVYVSTTVLALILILLAERLGHNFQNLNSGYLEPSNVIKNLLLVQTTDNSPSLNYPAWSVSAEFIAYCSFPFVITMFLGTRFKSRVSAFFLFMLAFCVHLYLASGIDVWNRNILQVLSQFTMGLCSFILIKDSIYPEKRIVFLRRFFVFILVVFVYLLDDGYVSNAILPLVLLLVVCTNYQHNFLNRGLSRIWIIKLGLWSYSIYLTHGLLQYVLSGMGLPRMFANPFFNIVQLLLVFLVVIFLGALTTRLVEVPARKYLLSKFLIS
jgi:peptidoglycan/LPS O-acetylase OafA/YrhL